jgi:hypothetical protein
MGFAGSADIFQAEMGNLMATLEYIRAYIDNLLVITKGSLYDHLDKLKQFFMRLRNAGLKINATKSIFCAQETECLGYILTRGDQTLTKEGAVNPRAQSAQQCQRTLTIPWYGPIL